MNFMRCRAGAERRRAARAHFRRDQPAGAGGALGALPGLDRQGADLRAAARAHHRAAAQRSRPATASSPPRSTSSSRWAWRRWCIFTVDGQEICGRVDPGSAAGPGEADAALRQHGPHAPDRSGDGRGALARRRTRRRRLCSLVKHRGGDTLLLSLGATPVAKGERRMAFTVISNSFKDGDYLPQGFHPVGRFRLWLRRRQHSRRI